MLQEQRIQKLGSILGTKCRAMVVSSQSIAFHANYGKCTKGLDAIAHRISNITTTNAENRRISIGKLAPNIGSIRSNAEGLIVEILVNVNKRMNRF